MTKIKCYTDGAYSSSRDQGGVGIVILKDDVKVLEYSKMYKHTTNNQMELIAIILALRTIKKPVDSIEVFSDSMYCIGCITKGWNRKKNQSLWKVLLAELDKISKLCSTIMFTHVKGHNGDTYNTICDKLAVSASKLISDE
jgi:ribonuclease HI